MPDLHAVHTMCDEGHSFVERHPELNNTQRSWGAVTWGLLRALMECPNCPGHFRVPRQATDGSTTVEVLWCSHCDGQWIHQDDLAELEEAKKPRQLGLFEETINV